MLIAICSIVAPQSIEAQAPVKAIKADDLVYRGNGENATQLEDEGLTREDANALNAQNQTGRWEPVLPDATPDHVDLEKVDDEISEHFDMFCDVIYAESGNQGDYGMRLVADVIINRMRSGEAFADTMKGVLTAPHQFSCIDDGHAKFFRGHEKESVRKIAQQELMQVTDPTIFYFRTGHYGYGVPAYKYRDVYFSRRQ